MKIYSAEQIRRWDAYTIAHEPISSLELMERAAQACADWIDAGGWQEQPIKIFCGKGNNGGDGLAIARLLIRKGYFVEVYILEFGKPGTENFQKNLQRLHALSEDLHFIQSTELFPFIQSTDIIVDALFGSGLNTEVGDLVASLIHHINAANATVVSIDVPSGLYLDRSSLQNTVVRASYTLTFEVPKLCLLVQENAPFMGEVAVLPIGLHPAFTEKEPSPFELVERAAIKQLYRPRNRFSHKGNFGHALLAAGSWGKMGAAILAAKACLRSGAGLLTCLLPRCGYSLLQTAVPEAMVVTDEDACFLTAPPEDLQRFSAIGVGPGIGTEKATQAFLTQIIKTYSKPMVLDADALNCLALQRELLSSLPRHSILTPHPKEFDRLFGEHPSDFDRIQTARKAAEEFDLVVLLKGHHTLIATPSGKAFFNSTGNAGMAKGGSGDVLTGLLTALLAQGYPPEEAALLGVYLHGRAGDEAGAAFTMETLLPSDLTLFLSAAFRDLQ